jgi:hypothetical protein
MTPLSPFVDAWNRLLSGRPETGSGDPLVLIDAAIAAATCAAVCPGDTV